MIDDIEDDSLKRRGQPCIHLKYGVDYACNTSNFIYFLPMNRLDDFIPKKHFMAFDRIYFTEMRNIHFGQNWDIHWHNGNKFPTINQYI
jgi:geranylgeranyl pyrophosphate synthase